MDPQQQQPTTPQNTQQPTSTQPLGAIPPQQTPPTEGSYTHPIADPPKQVYHPKRFMLALSIFVAVCLLAVVIMVLTTLMPEQKRTPVTDTDNVTNDIVQNPVSADLAITHVKEYFKGTESAKAAILLPVQAPDTAYYTIIPDIKPLTSVAGNIPADKADQQRTAITHSLEADEFTPNVISDGTEGANYQAYFTREDTICEVDVMKAKDPAAEQWIEVKCLDMSTYLAYAKAQAPYATIYTPLTSTSIQYAFVGKPTFHDSKVKGYQTLRTPVGSVINDRLSTQGQYALFYKTPDDIWHYLADQDNDIPLSCNLYRSNETKSAYAGTPCRVNANGSTQTIEAPKTNK